MKDIQPNTQAIIPFAILDAFRQIENIYEGRLFGWCLAKAQSVLKLYNKDLSDINMEFALDVARIKLPVRYLLAPTDHNYNNATKGFTLANKTLDYERGGRVFKLNIIAFPELVKENGKPYVTFLLHKDIWHALLNFGKGFRVISLNAYLSLSSTYSLVMYILVSNQRQPIVWRTDKLKQALGLADNKSVANNNNFFRRVLDPARTELNEKCPTTFDYTAARSGRGGGYNEITIIPRLSAPVTPPSADHAKDELIARQRLRLDDDVIMYLTENFSMEPHEIEQVEKITQAKRMDKLQLLDKLSQVKEIYHRTKRIKNVKGYIINTLKRA